MRRREFIAVVGATAAWPLAGRAQQPERLRRVGVLNSFAENDPAVQETMTAFAQALQSLGWVEGKNLRIDYGFAAGDPTLFKTYAAELVGLLPDAILVSGAPAVAAIQQETRTIPIVFMFAFDPVGLGFVQSLARPGGNITGFSSWDTPLLGKWLQLLKEMAPGVTRVAGMFNPDTVLPPSLSREIDGGARSLGMTVTLASVHDDAGIEETIASLAREPGGGLMILPGVLNNTHRNVIAAAAARYGLPSIGFRALLAAGVLMSYWFDPSILPVQAASYIDRILKGASPAELPVQQPTKYSLVINLKTAKALSLTVPPTMLDLGDEVIE
jgi:putative tryptophan/tyrosine transport system substrate-binding protein